MTNKSNNPFLLYIGLFISGIGIGLILSKSLLKNKTLANEELTNIAIDRCHKEKGFYLQNGFVNKRIQNIEELWRIAKENSGIVEIKNNKNQTVYGLSVTWLGKHLGDNPYLEVQPCTGDPMHLNISDSNDNPDRFLLIRRPHDQLKLVDTSISNKKPIIRGIHLIRNYR